jgi:hypothetical protein
MKRFHAGLNGLDLEAPLSKTILIAALFFLTSCANSLDMSGSRIKPPGLEWAVVIGSVLVQPETMASDKKLAGRDASGASYEFDIVQIQPGDPYGEGLFASSYQLNANAGEERIFISRLRPGQYLIRRFRQDAVTGLGGELDLVFDAAPGEVRYIGRVRIDLPQRVSSGKGYRFTVENARDPTLTRVSEQYGDLTKTTMDGPMHARGQAAP